MSALSLPGVSVVGSILASARDNKHVCFLITDWREWQKVKLLLEYIAFQQLPTVKYPKFPYSYAEGETVGCEVRVWAKASKLQVDESITNVAKDAKFYLSARSYNFVKDDKRLTGVVLKLHKFELI